MIVNFTAGTNLFRVDVLPLTTVLDVDFLFAVVSATVVVVTGFVIAVAMTIAVTVTIVPRARRRLIAQTTLHCDTTILSILLPECVCMGVCI